MPQQSEFVGCRVRFNFRACLGVHVGEPQCNPGQPPAGGQPPAAPHPQREVAVCRHCAGLPDGRRHLRPVLVPQVMPRL